LPALIIFLYHLITTPNSLESEHSLSLLTIFPPRGVVKVMVHLIIYPTQNLIHSILIYPHAQAVILAAFLLPNSINFAILFVSSAF